MAKTAKTASNSSEPAAVTLVFLLIFPLFIFYSTQKAIILALPESGTTENRSGYSQAAIERMISAALAVSCAQS